MSTENKGIDWSGPGSSVNRDSDTRIRYGIIPQNDCNPDALDDIFTEGEDEGYQDYLQRVKDAIKSAIDNFLDEDPENMGRDNLLQLLRRGLRDYVHDEDTAAEAIVDDIYEDIKGIPAEESAKQGFEAIECNIGDNYENTDGCARMDWEGDGYQLHTDSDGDLWVFKSQFFTYAQFCSPCAPGAGHLRNPLVSDEDFPLTEEKKDELWANRAYCLGHEWFEDEQAPYPVFSVETGKRVISRRVDVVCPNCKGIGRDTAFRLAAVRSTDEQQIENEIKAGQIKVQDFRESDNTFQCFRCDGKGKNQETVIEEEK